MGQFTEAIATAEKAAELARQQTNQALVTALHDERTLYQLGLPYRQSH